MENKNQTPHKNAQQHQMNWFQQFLMICSELIFISLENLPANGTNMQELEELYFLPQFATLSASYAMYTVFENEFTAVGFGILWGLMIFNLDRYIVSSIKKQELFGINFLWQFRV
jgi:hypothetical protein